MQPKQKYKPERKESEASRKINRVREREKEKERTFKRRGIYEPRYSRKGQATR